MNWPPKNGIAKTWRTAASIRGYAASCGTTWLVASNCKTQTCQWGIFNSFLMFSWLPSVICKGNSLCVTSLDNYLAMANYWPQQVGTPTPGGRPWRRTLPLRLLSGHWCRRSESFWRSFGLFFEDQTITNACFHLGLGTSENGVHIPPKFSSKKKTLMINRQQGVPCLKTPSLLTVDTTILRLSSSIAVCGSSQECCHCRNPNVLLFPPRHWMNMRRTDLPVEPLPVAPWDREMAGLLHWSTSNSTSVSSNLANLGKCAFHVIVLGYGYMMVWDGMSMIWARVLWR